jgi:hypothetical protein
MAEASGAAFRFAERFRHFQFRADYGLEYQLGHAFASSQAAFLSGSIEQENEYFTPVVWVDHTHSLGHGQAMHGAESAAGIDKARNARRGFHSNAGRHFDPRCGGYDEFFVFKAGAQIESGGVRRGIG